MNEFSMMCRALGSLWYRQPTDPLLAPLLSAIRDGKLASGWPLEQDALFERLQKSMDVAAIAADYQALFIGEDCRVPPYRSAWLADAPESEVKNFLNTCGMPAGAGPADHFGFLLLAASWLEDNAKDGDSEALETLFSSFLLPWSAVFLGKVEAHATSAFWRTLAELTRDALDAMCDELEESSTEA